MPTIFFLLKVKVGTISQDLRPSEAKLSTRNEFFYIDFDLFTVGLVRNYENKHRSGGIFYAAIKYNFMNRPIFTKCP